MARNVQSRDRREPRRLSFRLEAGGETQSPRRNVSSLRSRKRDAFCEQCRRVGGGSRIITCDISIGDSKGDFDFSLLTTRVGSTKKDFY